MKKMTKSEFDRRIEQAIREEVLFNGEEMGWEPWPASWRIDSAEVICENILDTWISPKCALVRNVARRLGRRYDRAVNLRNAFMAAFKRAA